MRRSKGSKTFIQILSLWIVILLVELIFFKIFTILDKFLLFILCYSILTGAIIAFLHSLVKEKHEKYIKCLLLSFVVFFISASIILPYGVLFKFMGIKAGHIPPFSYVFIEGLLFALKNSLYILVLSYPLILLTELLWAKIRGDRSGLGH